MSNTTITKVNSNSSSKGEMGQKYLSAGSSVAMRLWENEQPAEPKPKAVRDYETVGYVIQGTAELHLEDQIVQLAPGDSWVVPQGMSHTYKITEAFTAIEATSPPARVDSRDEA
ncbi:MAG: cupin domain-containing protein [Cyanobacteria bacterium J06631_6]